MTTMAETVKIEDGQVWFDNAKRTWGRKVKIVREASFSGRSVQVEVVCDKEGQDPGQTQVGRQYAIDRYRFGKKSGFTLESG